MDIERMTVRVQKSLNDAYNEAVKHHNQQVDVIHLFSALVNQEDGLIPNIFEKMNVSVAALKSTIDEELGKIPQIYGEGISSQGVTEMCIRDSVRGASLIGKGSEILMDIDMVSDNVAQAEGMCGSKSGSIPVNVGQPMIRVKSITVGGRE